MTGQHIDPRPQWWERIPTRPRKALAALVVGIGTGVGLSIIDGSALTVPELRQATGQALVASLAVWRVRNPVDRAKLMRMMGSGRTQPGPGDVM